MTAGGPALVWFRRDLRLDDNPAWAAATAGHDEVIAVFVTETALMRPAGALRRNQLLAHLRSLDEELSDLGGGLVVRSGPAAKAIPQLVTEVEAAAVYVNDDVTSFSRRRDRETFDDLSVPVHRFAGLLVHEPGSVLTTKGTLSLVFTPFHKRWADTPLTPWPRPGAGRSVVVAGEPLRPAGSPIQPPGSRNAWDRLCRWLERVDDYPDTRDLPAIGGTSELSADLKFGTIAARTILDTVGTATEGRSAFVRQLAWRDWWAHTLAERPDLPDRAIRDDYDRIRWIDDDDAFDAWAQGRTGYPIVDAGMRQLVATGWMHNRARMIAASFLVKDLLIDWRRGERFFRHHLVDADVAQNAGNWQWVAGTGPDAAPYFRIFNPTSQSERFDPEGDYIRHWVPELAALPGTLIHEPAAAGPLELATAGVVLDDTYPAPIVDHAEARTRTIEAYKAALG